MVGGYQAGGTTELLVAGADRWIPAQPLPRPLWGLRAAQLQDRLVVVGGWDGANKRAEIITWQEEEEAWQQEQTSTRLPVFHHGVSVVNIEQIDEFCLK